MMKYVLYVVLAWLLFQFIFNLLIPVYKTSRKIKKGFREMQEKMNQQQQAATSSTTPTASKPIAGDYIEFEEIK